MAAEEEEYRGSEREKTINQDPGKERNGHNYRFFLHKYSVQIFRLLLD